MTVLCQSVNVQGGATPNTYDGNGKINLHSKAKELIALIQSYSLTAHTAEEGGGMVTRLKGDFAEQFFASPVVFHAGPATNNAVKSFGSSILPLKIPVSGGEQLTFDLTSWGATQTGSFEATFGVLYRDQQAVPPDILARLGNIVPAQGGVFEYDAVAAATRQVLDGHGGAGNNGVMSIPAKARELIAILVLLAKDGAVTAAENMNGYVDLTGSVDLGFQEYPLPAIQPGLGTEVEGGDPWMCEYYPMHVPLPQNQAVQIKAFANIETAVTNNVAIAVNPLWR